MRGMVSVLPWAPPGLIASMVVGVAVSGWLARRIGSGRAVAWGLFVGFGLVFAATLTPLRDGLELGASVGTCDFQRVGIAPLDELFRIGDTSLNVLLFMPLGFALGLIPASRRRNVVLILAVATPFAIETWQLLLPVLARGCQSADVFDNLTGLFIGGIIGVGARILGSGSGAHPG
jgi:glycopeptide antibiotics resistance protein